MAGKPQPGAKRPKCDGCRRQRKCELVDGRRLCRECRLDALERLNPESCRDELARYDRDLVRTLLEVAGIDTTR